MAIGIDEDHRDLAASIGSWAEALGGAELCRAVEAGAGDFAAAWDTVVANGITTIPMAERLGGGDGDLLDAAVALEACARHIVPGPLLGTTVVAALTRFVEDLPADAVAGLADGARAGFAIEPTLTLDTRLTGEVSAYDAAGADLLVAGTTDGRWYLIPAAAATVKPVLGFDLSRQVARASVDADPSEVVELAGLTTAVVQRVVLALAAAEAAGVANWCLATAVEYAKVREQFGKPIGSFQAIKHLCAEMAETTEAVTAAAWDAAAIAGGDADQWQFATLVAGVTAFEGAVSVAQDCIQVLGGIGFTFEGDAHLYLRRATALRALAGSADAHAAALARSAVTGVRRRFEIDLAGEADFQARVREALAPVAALPEAGQRAALAESGYLVPHWPAPYGIDATPVQQLVVDAELRAAGIARPDLKIAAWALPTILQYGTDEQRERFLQPSLVGDLTWCQLFSEPGAGSDLASLATKAVKVDGGWKLTGQKVWTSLAAEADWGICLARTGGERHRGITYFLVDMTSDGLDIRPLREMTGDALFNEVFLDEVFVPDDCVVGEIDGGWRLARATLANERVAMAATRLDKSVERAVTLVSDGATEPDLVKVGRAVALATVCAVLGTRVTLRALAGQGPGPESSTSKLLGVRNRQQASDLVVELLGRSALELTAEDSDDIHEMLLTRCLSIAGGTTQVLRNVVAEQTLGLPRG